MHSAPGQKPFIIVFFTVAEPGGCGAISTTPSLPSLSKILFQMLNVFFFDWSKTFFKEHRVTQYVIQSILYDVWMFRNKATFHNGRENFSAIVKFICNDVITRLNVDFSRLLLSDFDNIWCHPALCELHERQIFLKFQVVISWKYVIFCLILDVTFFLVNRK